MVSLSVPLKCIEAFSRDLTESYVHSETPIERDIYSSAQSHTDLPPDTVFTIVRPLYGLPKRGLHWDPTNTNQHIDSVGMFRTPIDSYGFHRRTNGNLTVIVLLYVYGGRAVRAPEFFDEEERASQKCASKSMKILTTYLSVSNSSNILWGEHRTMKMRKEDKIDQLTCADSEKAFASVRAMIQYIGMNQKNT